jgi:ribosomal protein S18 acetylase RimI-like enzyme
MIRPTVLIHVRRKLIFLYLLRSSSALASISASHKQAAGLSDATPALVGHITLRVATRTDVPAIQRCNLATLPENYSSNFYVNHLRQWPDLALVAEHVLPGSEENERNNVRRNPFDSFDANQQASQNEIVGYVLGKVEETSCSDITTTVTSTSSSLFSQSKVSSDDESDEYYYNESVRERERKTEMVGHVTSLAVLPTFRRRGLAAKLMDQLHYHMDEGQGADGVGLHVRVSNIAARRLYCEGMGYGVVDVIRGYYQDGEDAFFMRKNFFKDRERERLDEEQHQQRDDGNSGTLSRFSLSRMRQNIKRRSSNAGSYPFSNIWECGAEDFRLPRIIAKGQGVVDVDSTSARASTSRNEVNDYSSPEDTNSQVMTGRL